MKRFLLRLWCKLTRHDWPWDESYTRLDDLERLVKGDLPCRRCDLKWMDYSFNEHLRS